MNNIMNWNKLIFFLGGFGCAFLIHLIKFPSLNENLSVVFETRNFIIAILISIVVGLITMFYAINKKLV